MLTSPQFWWVTALVLVLAEIFIPGAVLIFLAAAAALTALIASAGVHWVSVQLLIFILFSVALLFFMRPIWIRFAVGKAIPMGVDALIGKQARVVEVIDIHKGTGRVKIAADRFPAKSVDSSPISVDQWVTIKSVEGITLIVEESKY